MKNVGNKTWKKDNLTIAIYFVEFCAYINPNEFNNVQTQTNS